MSVQMPPSVVERIEAMASQADGKAIIRKAQALSQTYRSNTGSAKGEGDALAYTVSRMPATYAAAIRAMSLSLSCMNLQPEIFLDAGAGTGAVTLAISLLMPSCKCVCLEKEPAMRVIGEELTKAAGIEAEWRSFDLVEENRLPHAGLVAEGYMLCELPEQSRLSVIHKLWEAAEDMLLFIEPGTPAGYRILMEARCELLAMGAHVVAPCPGDLPCPLQEDDWCHFAVRLPRTRRMIGAKGGEAPFEDEKFSFLACTRMEPAPCFARILRHPRTDPGHVKLTLCTEKGKEDCVFTKKNPLWKRIRKVTWGDGL